MKYPAIILLFIISIFSIHSQTKIKYDSEYKNIIDSVLELNKADFANDTSGGKQVFDESLNGRFYIKMFENGKQMEDIESIRRGIPLICKATLSRDTDTLYIGGFWGLSVGFEFYLVLHADSLRAYYSPVSDEEIFKLKKDGSEYFNTVNVPSSSEKLILAQVPQNEHGEYVKGYTEFKSAEFYEKTSSGINTYRVEMKVYFSPRINKY